MATQNSNFIQIDAVAKEGRLLWITCQTDLLINFKHFITASEIARKWTRPSCVREVNLEMMDFVWTSTNLNFISKNIETNVTDARFS